MSETPSFYYNLSIGDGEKSFWNRSFLNQPATQIITNQSWCLIPLLGIEYKNIDCHKYLLIGSLVSTELLQPERERHSSCRRRSPVVVLGLTSPSFLTRFHPVWLPVLHRLQVGDTHAMVFGKLWSMKCENKHLQKFASLWNFRNVSNLLVNIIRVPDLCWRQMEYDDGARISFDAMDGGTRKFEIWKWNRSFNHPYISITSSFDCDGYSSSSFTTNI